MRRALTPSLDEGRTRSLPHVLPCARADNRQLNANESKKPPRLTYKGIKKLGGTKNSVAREHTKVAIRGGLRITSLSSSCSEPIHCHDGVLSLVAAKLL